MELQHTLKFIKCVQKYPIIYDSWQEDFKNYTKKLETWEVISKEMNGESSDVLRTKWKGLKDGYVKYKKQSQEPPGYGKTYHNWCWGPHLKFLDPFLKKRKYRNRITIDDNSSFQCTSSTSIPSPQPTTTKRPVQYTEEFIIEPISVLPSTSSYYNSESSQQSTSLNSSEEDIKKILNYLKKKSSRTSDAIDLLFASYAETYRKLSMKTQMNIKVQMAALFANAELEEYNNSEHSVIERDVNTIGVATASENISGDFLIPDYAVVTEEGIGGQGAASLVQVKMEMTYDEQDYKEEDQFIT